MVGVCSRPAISAIFHPFYVMFPSVFSVILIPVLAFFYEHSGL